MGNTSTRDRRAGRRTAAFWLAGAAFVIAPPAAAQPAAADPVQTPDADETDQTIIVTGSRVARPGFTSPTPVTTVDPADLARVSAPNVADAINQLPALKASATPTATTNLSALAGGNYLDLRGLTFLRTLTLIDGNRYVPTTTTGAVNINLIPQALIQSVEVVTGGASAAYGSDAVAGVVNLKLARDLNGIRGSVQGGISDHDDHRNYLASVAGGTAFAGGAGRVVVGLEAAKNGGVSRLSRRDWGRSGVIFNPAYTETNGEPLLLRVPDARYSNAAYGGLILSPPFAGQQFGPGGTLTPFNFGTLVSETDMNGGDGVAQVGDNVLETPLERYSAYGRIGYDVATDVEAFASFAWGRTSFISDNITGEDEIGIARDNVFLPAQIRTTLAAVGAPGLLLGRSLNDYARGKIDQTVTTWQGVLGLGGKFADGWSFEASYAYGRTHNETLFTGNRITARWQLAVDAVANPANGQPICRSTLSNPGNGCIPINLFGVGSPSPEAINYVTGTSRRDWEIGQHVVDGVIRGTPFATWAGDVSFAAGGQWRRLSADIRSDPLSVARAFRVGNVQPYDGRVTVTEGFAEVVVPLASGQGWAKLLELDLAGRVTDYSTSGTVETWKAGVNWAVNDSVRLRATRSRDIRAPSIDELFARGATLINFVTDPVISQTYSVQAIVGGNPDLKPEKADTFTGGIVLTPSFIPRLSLSVDYYDIKLKGAINTLSSQAIVTLCAAGNQAVCPLITRENGRITRIALAPANFQRITTRGVDVELGYRIPIGAGRIDLQGLVNYVDRLRLVSAGTSLDFAGNTDQPIINGIGGVPHWRANVNASYSNDDLRLSATGRFVGGGKLTDDDTLFNGARVNGRVYLDLSGEVTLIRSDRGRVALFGVVQNALDQDPPITGLTGYATNRALYDIIGRQYTAGVRFSF